MTSYRHHLPQLGGTVFLTDGGIETTLIFDDGLDLPDFAAFDLLDDPDGAAALVRYFDRYADDRPCATASGSCSRRRRGAPARTGVRASATPSSSSPTSTAGAVELARGCPAPVTRRPTTPIVISGCIGPRGDGYDPDDLMSAERGRRLPRAADRDVRRHRGATWSPRSR